jgi:hypothetical protein
VVVEGEMNQGLILIDQNLGASIYLIGHPTAKLEMSASGDNTATTRENEDNLD